MTTVIEPLDGRTAIEVTRHFRISTTEAVSDGEWRPTLVVVSWTHWPNEVPSDDEESGPMRKVAVYGLRLNRDGSVRKGAALTDMCLARAEYPQWLTDLLGQYDDHGNPVQ